MRPFSSLAARLSPAAFLPVLMVLLTSCSKYGAGGNTRFIWLVILAFDIFAMIDVFRQGWELPKKLLWLALIYFMPFLGLILYYTISGRNKPA